MIKGYFEFINVSIIKYSDQFRNILGEINDSAISLKLLSIEDKDYDIPTNFIDLGSEIDSITFTPDQKAQKFLQDGTEQDVYNHNRQSTKIGRAVRNLLKSSNLEFTDAEIEKFVNKFKAKVKQSREKYENFEIVKGDRIAYWYNYNQYEILSGDLGNSCMCEMKPDVFNIYTYNPEVVCLLILKSTKSPNKIIGRALIWDVTCESKEIKFMDRIYCINDSDVELFRSYALNHDIFYKSGNNSNEHFNLVGKDTTIEDAILTTFIHEGFDTHSRYPYMDSLKYLCLDECMLTNDFDSDYICLEGTDGYHDQYCLTCGGSREIECPYCYGDGWREATKEVQCEDCEGTGVDGEVECEMCGGNGEKEVDGEVECEMCDGCGFRDCHECTH